MGSRCKTPLEAELRKGGSEGRRPAARRDSHEGIYAERCHPRGQICINWPAAVFANGRFDELQASLCHGMIKQAASEQTHADKTGQR